MRIVIEVDGGSGTATLVAPAAEQSSGALGSPTRVNAGAAPSPNGRGGGAEAGAASAGTSVDAGPAPTPSKP